MAMPRDSRSNPRQTLKGPTRSAKRRASADERLKQKLIERLAALTDMLERRRRNTYRDNIGALIYLNPGDPVPEGLIKVDDEDTPDPLPRRDGA